ncbi:hypothetical protein LCGC14_0364480 [marine sediment metagenome]|uniref:Uncharacterized protein n=1 Tax=marine sediment metagenome TaxID=412755 RepID=A0A0F9VU25_9ZZZZ
MVKTIRYIKSRHERERITKWLTFGIEKDWIKSELERMKKVGIVAYVVKRRKDVAICHKDLHSKGILVE